MADEAESKITKAKMIQIYHEVTKEQFLNQISAARVPAVLKGVDLGDAVEKWTPQYLAKVGGEKPVKVHVCNEGRMDFIHKNFAYKTLPFNHLVMRASENVHSEYFFSPEEKYYLRSLGEDPRKDISDISVHFPSLAQDIKLPDLYPEQQFFSSVFRIASPGCQLWTHYDIMDNLLIQVSGRKRVVLFSPQDASNLYLNGDKSEVLNIDNPDLKRFPRFSSAVPFECHLEAGDVLFIPALWFHNVLSIDFGVAVNVFWRHLDVGLYDKKDIYGNKDLLPATQAMQMADKLIKQLDQLPQDYRDFYARRIACKLENKCYILEEKEI
ncbi:tRNA wybutosine-synthesizing protein 5-like [Actinia tenebrosa]|uniref:tRNA wybutosine-synthesizing protein 5 n=1 Tax=Actinia tenebrosa TaxID=6105 RepID=A0A6P8I2U9_ACTTE|nr:tRNA wybutosine-synthesizing protein 5-like [Actinia tenebrosa]